MKTIVPGVMSNPLRTTQKTKPAMQAQQPPSPAAPLPLLARLQQLPQVLLFVLVGGSAAAVHLLAVGALVAWVGLAPLLANGLAFLLAFIVSYNGHAWLTFAAHQARGWAVVGRFFAVASLSFMVNELLYVLALQWLHWHYFWSQAGILVLVAVGTFAMSKFWAFKRREAR